MNRRLTYRSPALRGAGEPPASFKLPDFTFYPTPGNLREYYASLHRYILAVQQMASDAKGSACFPERDLEEWRVFRERWADFYSKGPSTWFTLLSEDPDRALYMHKKALQWEAYIVSACPELVQPVANIRRPIGTPQTVAQAIDGVWRGVKSAAGSIAQSAGKGFGASVEDFSSTMMWIGFGVLALGGAYIGIRYWRR
jgi:hypothetical protein